MYSNNIVNCQESTTIVNACTKKSGNLLFFLGQSGVGSNGNEEVFYILHISKAEVLPSDGL